MTPTPSRARRGLRADPPCNFPAASVAGPFPPCSAQRPPSIPRRSSPVPPVSGAAPRVAIIAAGDDAACWPLRHSPALAATLTPSGMVPESGTEPRILTTGAETI
jgi:hypothetical protein